MRSNGGFISAIPTMRGQNIGGITAPRIVVFQKTAQSPIGSTATSITALAVPVLAGQWLQFTALICASTSSAILGASVSCTGPAAATLIYRTEDAATLSTVVTNTNTAYDSYAALTTSVGSSVGMSIINGVIQFSAAGTFYIRVKASGINTITVLPGSSLSYHLF